MGGHIVWVASYCMGAHIVWVAILYWWSGYMGGHIAQVASYCMGGHIAWVDILHRWPYCTGGHIARVAILSDLAVADDRQRPAGRRAAERRVVAGRRAAERRRHVRDGRRRSRARAPFMAYTVTACIVVAYMVMALGRGHHR